MASGNHAGSSNSPTALTNAVGEARVCDAQEPLYTSANKARAAKAASTGWPSMGGAMDGPPPWSTLGIGTTIEATRGEQRGSVSHHARGTGGLSSGVTVVLGTNRELSP